MPYMPSMVSLIFFEPYKTYKAFKVSFCFYFISASNGEAVNS